MATIVTPGTVVGTADKNSPGAGTAEENGNLVALLTGVVVENDGVLSIETHNSMLRLKVATSVSSVAIVVRFASIVCEFKVI